MQRFNKITKERVGGAKKAYLQIAPWFGKRCEPICMPPDGPNPCRGHRTGPMGKPITCAPIIEIVSKFCWSVLNVCGGHVGEHPMYLPKCMFSYTSYTFFANYSYLLWHHETNLCVLYINVLQIFVFPGCIFFAYFLHTFCILFAYFSKSLIYCLFQCNVHYNTRGSEEAGTWQVPARAPSNKQEQPTKGFIGKYVAINWTCKNRILTPYGNSGGSSCGKILLHTQLRFCPPGKPILRLLLLLFVNCCSPGRPLLNLSGVIPSLRPGPASPCPGRGRHRGAGGAHG